MTKLIPVAEGPEVERRFERYRLLNAIDAAKGALIVFDADVQPDTKPGTFSNRNLAGLTVKERTRSTWGDSEDYSITASDGWTAGCTKEVYDLLPEGTEYVMEKYGPNFISGWFINGRWYDHRSDEEFEEDRLKRIKAHEEEDARVLAANEATWQKEEDALPDWLKSRLAIFHEKGGRKFKLSGWGYELVIARLAAEYVVCGLAEDKSFIESPTIEDIAREVGSTGNQHDVAKMLARQKLAEPGFDAENTPSGLTPITGDPYFEK